ncbi:barren [Coemansia reversa NRRL 1564]|uniref:Condensin complex subunit 2 n=1 Tax=Coemansia reversa (strain ATCC 12441 / NRRL 1564) TaxID=763665 RepID=A0A2G5B6V1_COERN|nr:barren [Coemansia reversa NRRL 1564]|eukprot:PIA14457.1 barren [Coemansia reversa NRRL 1564]
MPQSPRLNDDAAERRRRRKSAMERRRSNLVTPRRVSTKGAIFNHSPQLGSPATAAFAVQLPRLTPEELNQRYEEWMKIAADNKINANNTWDFALIDYFYDMSLLREGDSINFQKASCTLDGCVKIYSSRVDSVASETGRLLSGLAEAPGKRGRHASDDDDGDGDNEESEGRSGRQKTRRPTQAATTLAKDFASISVKKLDLEFSVDPLFKKTSADFDEGGARGLLLNHLGLDAEGRIVFDASDSTALVDSDYTTAEGEIALSEHDATEDAVAVDADVETEQQEQQAMQQLSIVKTHRTTPVDISLLEDILGTVAEHLDDAQICPSLADFEFTRDTSLDFSLLKEHLREDEEPEAERGMDDEETEGQGSFGGIGDDDDMGHFLNFDESEDGPVPLETASTLQAAEAEEATESGAAAASGYGPGSLKMSEDEDNLLSYFDTKLARGWAGPEHWRLPISRAVMQKQLLPHMQQTGDDEAAAGADDAEAKRKRTDKQVYYTDFMNGTDVNAAELFAKPVRASVITMSKKAAQNQNHTLPEDVHFSSKNLFNMFLKPKLRFNPRRMRTVGAVSNTAGSETAGSDNYGGFVVDGDDSANVFGMGGSGDDDDGARFDDGDDYDDDVLQLSAASEADGAGEANKSGIPQLKLIRPLHVNYARRAKRVNVKRLKDNIWREMAAAGQQKSQVMDAADPEDISQNGDADALTGDQKFSEVVSNLKNVYPPEKLEELSISYCFICLLHLANERNLRIEGETSLRDLVITQDHFD